MENKYLELFDEVHASGRLRTEVMNMRHEGHRHTRRVPRAALIAAVLILVLAGTALATGVLEQIKIKLEDPDETNSSGSGYSGQAEYRTIPAENLSDAARQRAAEMEESTGSWEFDSWAAAEDFLGLELMHNPILEEMPLCGKRGERAGCGAFVINYEPEEGEAVPFLILLSAAYRGEGCRITQSAYLQFQYPGYPGRETGFGLGTHKGETYLEDYETPGGIKVSIVTTTGTRRYGLTGVKLEHTDYFAYFLWNDVFYSLHAEVSDPVGHPDAVNALATMKAILDAYE